MIGDPDSIETIPHRFAHIVASIADGVLAKINVSVVITSDAHRGGFRFCYVVIVLEHDSPSGDEPPRE